MLKIREKISILLLKHKLEVTNLNKKIWANEKERLKCQNQIDEEKKELKGKSKEMKLPSWSKLLSLLLFINFTALEIFVGWVTVRSFALAFQYGTSPDFTPLITLMSAVLGETISYAIYALKSKAENTKGGIVYESMIQQMQSKDEEETLG